MLVGVHAFTERFMFIQKQIDCPYPTSLSHTVRAHGWVKLAPWHWDDDHNELTRPELLETGRSVLVKVSQSNFESIIVQINADILMPTEHESIKSIVKRWLSIDWDPSDAIRIATSVDQRVALFIKHGGGRFLRGSTFYEDLIKTICTINTNWASTRRMVLSLVNRLGEGVFPTPLEIISYGEDFLRKELRLGFRSRVIVESSRQLLEKGFIDDRGNLVRRDLKFEDLIALRGIGPYSASHLMMLTHDFGCIPIDSEVTRYCREHYDVEQEEIETFFQRWGKYRFLGYKLSRIVDDTNWTG